MILGNTGQNVLGLAIGAVATFAAQVIMTQRLGDRAYGVVTLTTQFAFIAAAATRFGMDVANVRLVAILVGRGEAARSRALVRRAGAISAAVSVPFAVLAYFLAPWLADTFFSGNDGRGARLPRGGRDRAVRGAGLHLHGCDARAEDHALHAVLAVDRAADRLDRLHARVLGGLGGHRGAAGWAFGASWALALAIAAYGWQKEQRRFPHELTGTGIPEEHTGALLRFGALRAPGTLFSQLIFWTDLFVLSLLSSGQGAAAEGQVGVYSAVLRAGQALFLFLTSVSLTFSPFVADLHHRGETTKLDGLYKQVTRWTLAATIPVLLVLAIMPGPVLRIFGAEFVQGEDALRILIIGMIVPVMVGTVGFILIMAGRTGWDLLVYVGGFTIDVGLALALARPEVLGIRGAAIAQAATLTFSALARLFLVRRFLGIWPFDGSYLRLVVPTVVGGLVMAAAHAVLPEAKWLVNLLASAAAGTGAYVVALLAIGLKPNERATAMRLAGKVLGRGRAPA